MTLTEIRDAVMFQTGNDTTDYTEYEPYLTAYINEGYDGLLMAYDKTHVGDTDSPALSDADDVPVIPTYNHWAIADYATFRVFQNGGPDRQRRGSAFFGKYRDSISNLSQKTGTDVVVTNTYAERR